MNVSWRVLRMPWLATMRSRYSYMLLFVWFCLIVDGIKATDVHGDARQFAAAVLVLALGAVWRMVANSLWLAYDARRLRLPGMERDADRALGLFACATVLLPALVGGAMFGHIAVWLVSLALIAAASLAFSILPLAVTLPPVALAIVAAAFAGWTPPVPGDPDFLAWATPALAILLIATLMRWHALRHASAWGASRWLRPATAGQRLLAMRRLQGSAHLMPPELTASAQPRRHDAERLRDVGPAHPVRSIRTAVGMAPWDVRFTRAHAFKWHAAIGALMLAPAVIAMLVQRHDGPAWMFALVPQIPMLLAIMLVIPTPEVGQGAASRWRNYDKGSALLALLPRLATAARIKRDALIACAASHLIVQCCFAASAAVAFAVLRLPAMFYAYLVLIAACGVLLNLAIVAYRLGGKPLRAWQAYALFFSTLVVPMPATAAWGLRVVAGTPPHLATLGWPAVTCITLWVLWCAGFALLALRGWRALQRRPHPFLPNPSA